VQLDSPRSSLSMQRPASMLTEARHTSARWCPVSDGLSVAHSGMRFSLISRELIADSVEATVRAHQWDGIFAIGGCDKNLPGLMMGMVRCNVPSIFLYGGSALPGRQNGRDVNIVDTYELIGKVLAGDATQEQLQSMARSCYPPPALARVSTRQTRWGWCQRR